MTERAKKATNKTQPSAAAPDDAVSEVYAYIDAVSNPTRRKDAETMLDLMARVTGDSPRMWGPSIIGYSQYHYRYPSGREGDAPAAGFSPRSTATTVYLADGVGAHSAALERLGAHTASVGCLYLKSLDRVDLDVLESIIADSFATVSAADFGQRARDSTESSS